jgi:hypothetical protein
VRARVGLVQVQREALVLAPAAPGARVVMHVDRNAVIAAGSDDVGTLP